jgi:hypothetical protein
MAVVVILIWSVCLQVMGYFYSVFLFVSSPRASVVRMSRPFDFAQGRLCRARAQVDATFSAVAKGLCPGENSFPGTEVPGYFHSPLRGWSAQIAAAAELCKGGGSAQLRERGQSPA